MNLNTTARRLVYPEIECWPAVGVSSTPKKADGDAGTSIDILEVAGYIPNVIKGLNDASMLEHFANTPHSLLENKNNDVALRIFFIESLNLPSNWREPGSKNIASWMMDSFGVSPLFFQFLSPEVAFRHDGGTSFPTKDLNGTVLSLDGFYQIAAGIRSEPSFLWFKHALSRNKTFVASTYICYKCPEAAKQKIISLVIEKPSSLVRPLSIDAMIMAERLYDWGEELHQEHGHLRHYIAKIPTGQLSKPPTKAVHNLRNLAEHFHVIRTVLEDLREHIENLSRMHQSPAYSHLFQPKLHVQQGQEYGAVRESLSYLSSQTRTMTRWVNSYIDQTDIMMDHLFNLFTSEIAIATQRDSSSMITMAAVTMFFLPGTFVSALFSMVFFNTNEANTGLSVNSQLWLFFAVTIPLTIAVFVIWELWRHHRQRQQAAPPQTDQEESFEDINDKDSILLALHLPIRESPSPMASHSTRTSRRRSRRSSESVRSITDGNDHRNRR